VLATRRSPWLCSAQRGGREEDGECQRGWGLGVGLLLGESGRLGTEMSSNRQGRDGCTTVSRVARSPLAGAGGTQDRRETTTRRLGAAP
jgi:hypothetical protein